MSNSFYDEIFSATILHHSFDYDDLNKEFLEFYSGTFDYPGFIINYRLTLEAYSSRPDRESLINTYKILKKLINNTKHIIDKTPNL